ncbi:MAG: hypothetical protein J3Q66DRAFT_430610 [Benniella sp.]|nr:MAG: hypothetical protein J3Q66DRAFT_430610 [Benniella sp.]
MLLRTPILVIAAVSSVLVSGPVHGTAIEPVRDLLRSDLADFIQSSSIYRRHHGDNEDGRDENGNRRHDHREHHKENKEGKRHKGHDGDKKSKSKAKGDDDKPSKEDGEAPKENEGDETLKKKNPSAEKQSLVNGLSASKDGYRATLPTAPGTTIATVVGTTIDLAIDIASWNDITPSARRLYRLYH